MTRSLEGFCVSLLALSLWSAPVSAAVIYAVAGDDFGLVPTTLYEIDPDAQTTRKTGEVTVRILKSFAHALVAWALIRL